MSCSRFHFSKLPPQHGQATLVFLCDISQCCIKNEARFAIYILSFCLTWIRAFHLTFNISAFLHVVFWHSFLTSSAICSDIFTCDIFCHNFRYFIFWYSYNLRYPLTFHLACVERFGRVHYIFTGIFSSSGPGSARSRPCAGKRLARGTERLPSPISARNKWHKI